MALRQVGMEPVLIVTLAGSGGDQQKRPSGRRDTVISLTMPPRGEQQ